MSVEDPDPKQVAKCEDVKMAFSAMEALGNKRGGSKEEARAQHEAYKVQVMQSVIRTVLKEAGYADVSTHDELIFSQETRDGFDEVLTMGRRKPGKARPEQLEVERYDLRVCVARSIILQAKDMGAHPGGILFPSFEDTRRVSMGEISVHDIPGGTRRDQRHEDRLERAEQSDMPDPMPEKKKKKKRPPPPQASAEEGIEPASMYGPVQPVEPAPISESPEPAQPVEAPPISPEPVSADPVEGRVKKRARKVRYESVETQTDETFAPGVSVRFVIAEDDGQDAGPAPAPQPAPAPPAVSSQAKDVVIDLSMEDD